MSLCANPLPHDHVSSLAAIEGGYWWFSARTYWAEQLIQAALHYQGLKASHTGYLDLGCGTGGFANDIVARIPFQQATLADGDPNVLKLAERYPGFRSVQVDLNENFTLPAPAQIITCMDVIEHLPDDRRFLKRLAEQMPTSGNLILSVPASPTLYSEWDRQLGHYRRYTTGGLQRLLQDSGFRIQFLSPMWCSLWPAAFVRKLRASRYRESMEFEKIPAFLNRMFLALSRAEWAIARRVRLPYGTSLIAWVTKHDQ